LRRVVRGSRGCGCRDVRRSPQASEVSVTGIWTVLRRVVCGFPVFWLWLSLNQKVTVAMSG
jgi:hypothetical protein